MSAEKLKKYETIVVTKTDAGHEAHRQLYEKVTDAMAKAGAHHIRFELWGKRRLAYMIKKSTKGIYMYYMYLADGDFVRELNRQLRISPIVLRFLTVKLADDIDSATYDFEKEKQFDPLPTEADDSHDHGRPMTGWELEYPSRDSSKTGKFDDDDDDDDDDEDKEGREEGAEGTADDDEED